MNKHYSQLAKSLIKIRDKRGPKIDPCGTPSDNTGRIDEEVLITETYWLRSDKYDWNHLLFNNDHVSIFFI